MRDVAQVRHEGAVTLEIAREALELLEVDEAGLERTDRELLSAIAHKFEGGPVGLSTLAVSLGEEPDTIEDVYEPYLLQLGFLQRTPRGRVITALGREHIGAARRRPAGSSDAMPAHLDAGMHAGPLDELVAAISRMVATFAQEHALEQAEVRHRARGRLALPPRRLRPRSRGSGSSRSSRTASDGRRAEARHRPDRRGEGDRDLRARSRAAVRVRRRRVTLRALATEAHSLGSAERCASSSSSSSSRVDGFAAGLNGELDFVTESSR